MAFLLCRACNAPLLRVSTIKNATILRVPVFKEIPRKQIFRTFTEKEPTKPRRTLREFLSSPSSELPFNIGKLAVGIGGVSALGALCYYGAGYGSEPGAFDKQKYWPQYVKDRIHITYLFFVTAITITAIFAGLTFHCQDIMNYVANNNIISMIISFSAIIGTGLLTQSAEYKPEFGYKHLIWMSHCAVTGCVLAPMCHVGGKIWIMATIYTWCIVAALAIIAMTAPAEQFLMTRGPLAMGVSMVLTSAFGTWSFPHGSVLGAVAYSIFLYGGLIVFSGFLLHDTQRIIKRAETYPLNPGPGQRVYDPINAGMEMYMDVFNIFFRLVAILDIMDLIENFVEIVVKGK